MVGGDGATTAHLPQLRDFVRHVASFNRVTQKINLIGPTFVKSNQILSFDLPSSSICALETLALHGQLSVTTTGGIAWFPKHAESMVQRVVLETPTTQIDPGCQYTNILFKMLMDVHGGVAESKRAVLSLAKGWGKTGSAYNGFTDTAPLYSVVGNNGPTLAGNPLLGNLTNMPFVITTFPGALNSFDSWFNTDLVGNTRVSLTLAGPEILGIASTDTAGADYNISGLYVTLDTVSVDGAYYEAIRKTLSGGVDSQGAVVGGAINKRFHQWYTFRGSTNGGTVGNTQIGGYDQALTVNLASQSVDLVFGTFIRANASLPMRNGSFNASASGPGTYNKCEGDSSLYFDRLGAGVSRWQMQVNNGYLPQYQASGTDDAFLQVMNVMGETHDLTSSITPNVSRLSYFSTGAANGTNPYLGSELNIWTRGFWYAAVSLNAQEPASMRATSGYDSRGSNASIRFVTIGNNASNANTQELTNVGQFSEPASQVSVAPIVFVRCSAVLRIGANRTHVVFR